MEVSLMRGGTKTNHRRSGRGGGARDGEDVTFDAAVITRCRGTRCSDLGRVQG
jgi:hypothetical protein